MSGYYSFYNYCNEVLHINYKSQQKWDCYLKLSNCGLIYPFEDFVVISEKPTSIKIKNMVLHSDNSPSIEYADGFKVYSLNGIQVPEWLVMTPAEKIDPKLALEEKNADVQREIIRKIGYERMLNACNAQTIDKWDCPKTQLHYELKRMKFGAVDRLYMCYEHASIPGVFYAKPVPPETKNCVQGRGFQTGIVTREDLKNVSDEYIINRLPETVQ